MATQAKMGFVGFVRFVPIVSGTYTSTFTNPLSIRVTSSDVKLTQDISYPDVVDNKIDQTLYQLGPAQVGGTIQFPLVHEGGELGNLYGHDTNDCTNGDGASLVSNLWQMAADRDEVGRMKNAFDCHIRYADNLGYEYFGCLINQMTFTVNQSEPVNVSCELIGGATTISSTASGVASLRGSLNPNASTDLTKMLAPARIVTWNDAVMSFWRENGSPTGSTQPDGFLTAKEIRQFTCSINNNIERFYTLNGKLGPQDIAAKKREISGTLDIMGHNNLLSDWTATNETRFTAPSGIAFGYKLGNSATAYWATGLFGVVFEIEEVGLSTGLFETKTKWRALGDCTNSYLATKLGGTDVSLPLTRTSNFGSGITGAYPAFRANNLP